MLFYQRHIHFKNLHLTNPILLFYIFLLTGCLAVWFRWFYFRTWQPSGNFLLNQKKDFRSDSFKKIILSVKIEKLDDTSAPIREIYHACRALSRDTAVFID